MADLYITYWATVDKYCAGDPIKTEKVTTSGTSAQSGAIPFNAVVATVTGIALHCVTLGDAPTAAVGAGSFILPANAERDIRLTNHAAATYKFAAITL